MTEFKAYHGIDRQTAAQIMWAHGCIILRPRATPPAYMVPADYGRPAWNFPLHEYDGSILKKSPGYVDCRNGSANGTIETK